jgi:DNA recombination protein RmuC
MEWVGPVIGVVAGFLLGAGTLWLLMKGQRDSAQSALSEERTKRQEAEVGRVAAEERAKQVEALKDEVAQRDQRLSDLEADLRAEAARAKGLETQLEEKQRHFDEQRKMLDQAKEQLREAFAALSQEALIKNNAAFLDLAKENLQSFAKEAKGDLEKRQEAIAQLVQPIGKTLDELRKQAQELEAKREGAYGQISQQIKEMRESQSKLEKEAQNLTIALRNPQARGKWGEMQLRILVEQAGMVPYVDFFEQTPARTEDGSLRPDMIIRLPNDKRIVVDAKTPEAYLQAMQTEDENERLALLRQHGAFVKRHMLDLSSKRYGDQFGFTPDFVVMFLPGESFFAAALQAEPTLIEFGAEKNVLLASPTTLLALLKAVHYGWRQENLAANAQRIADRGKDLYERLCTALDHFAKTGKNLSTAVGAYNDAVGSIERSVLPAARDMKEMGLATGKLLTGPAPVTESIRRLQAPEAGAPPEPPAEAAPDGAVDADG